MNKIILKLTTQVDLQKMEQTISEKIKDLMESIFQDMDVKFNEQDMTFLFKRNSIDNYLQAQYEAIKKLIRTKEDYLYNNESFVEQVNNKQNILVEIEGKNIPFNIFLLDYAIEERLYFIQGLQEEFNQKLILKNLLSKKGTC